MSGSESDSDINSDCGTSGSSFASLSSYSSTSSWESLSENDFSDDDIPLSEYSRDSTPQTMGYYVPCYYPVIPAYPMAMYRPSLVTSIDNLKESSRLATLSIQPHRTTSHSITLTSSSSLSVNSTPPKKTLLGLVPDPTIKPHPESFRLYNPPPTKRSGKTITVEGPLIDACHGLPLPNPAKSYTDPDDDFITLITGISINK